MIRRRNFVAGSLAAPLLAGPFLAAASIAAKPSSGSGKHPGHYSIGAFILELSVLGESGRHWLDAPGDGSQVRTIDTDITPVYDWLDRSWRSTPFAIAGMTSRDSLFVIERLAIDRGLRLVALSDGPGEQKPMSDYWRLGSGSGPLSWIIEPIAAGSGVGHAVRAEGQA